MRGRAAANHDRLAHGLAQLGPWDYACSGGFRSSLFENWESELLQMMLFVLLTVALRQVILSVRLRRQYFYERKIVAALELFLGASGVMVCRLLGVASDVPGLCPAALDGRHDSCPDAKHVRSSQSSPK